MSRQTLKARKDGRYQVKYKGKCFYGQTLIEALGKRKNTSKISKQVSAPSKGKSTKENISQQARFECLHFLRRIPYPPKVFEDAFPPYFPNTV